MMIHRIVRAPEKRTFYLNIGGIPPEQVDNFILQTVSKMKRTPHIDPTTGEYNLKYNLQNMLEDFIIPVRGGDTSTKIESTPGLQYDGITDVSYLRDKLFAALKVPKAFLGYEKDIEGKATLASQDIRFARTIERIQRIVIGELTKISTVHLYMQGFTGEDLVNFELSMTTPSIIYDQERVALLKEQVELAKTILDSKLLPSEWIYDNLFHISEDLFDDYRELIAEDQKRFFRWNQIQSEGNDPLMTGVSFGTPHDLAVLYGKDRTQANQDLPTGYNEKPVLGRPKEHASTINTQDSNFSVDRLGKKVDLGIESNPITHKYKNKSPLTLENRLNKVQKDKQLLLEVLQSEKNTEEELEKASKLS